MDDLAINSNYDRRIKTFRNQQKLPPEYVEVAAIKLREHVIDPMIVQKNINTLRDRLIEGFTNPGTDSRCLGNCVFEHRARGGGRLYVKDRGGDTPIEILAKSGKNRHNQETVIKIVRELYVRNNN